MKLIPASVLAVLIFCAPLQATNKYNRTVPIGIDYLAARGICVVFGANIESGDFFKDLESRSTSRGRVFRKKSKPVEAFPTELFVQVQAAVDRCRARAEAHQDRAQELEPGEHFMESLRFEAFWKNGFEMKRLDAELLSTTRIPSPTPSSSRAEWWQYRLVIRSQGVPLKDSVVIVVLSATQVKVARFSARL